MTITTFVASICYYTVFLSSFVPVIAQPQNVRVALDHFSKLSAISILLPVMMYIGVGDGVAFSALVVVFPLYTWKFWAMYSTVGNSTLALLNLDGTHTSCNVTWPTVAPACNFFFTTVRSYRHYASLVHIGFAIYLTCMIVAYVRRWRRTYSAKRNDIELKAINATSILG